MVQTHIMDRETGKADPKQKTGSGAAVDFYRRVGVVLRAVPEGHVVTYGQIALLCGRPKNARQVGYALKNDLSGQVPAHRVVNGQGFLSGAASFDYPGLQKQLLMDEGVAVSPDNRVDLKKFGWRNTLKDAMGFLDEFEREKI